MKVFFALTIGLCALLTAAHPTANQIDILDTLDEYSLLGILEHLEFGDFAALAAVDPRIIQMAEHYGIIPEILGKNGTLHIQLSMRNGPHAKAYYIPVNDALSTMHLCTGFDNIRNTLQAFCPLFGRLLLEIGHDYSSRGNQTLEVVDYINRYCAAIPQKVVVRKGSEIFRRFAAASNVSSLLIEYPEYLKKLLINTFFPQLQELAIQVNGFFAINEHLPHLQHFEMADSSCGHFDLETFGEFNPQVRSLKLDLCRGLDALNEVNELFPNLESLHYRPKKDERRFAPLGRSGEKRVQSVRFRNVRSYTIVIIDPMQGPGLSLSGYLDELSAIQFDQLESLTYITWVNGVQRKIQLDFVLQYKQVKSLDFSSYGLTYEEVWRLVDSLPNLSEITFRERSAGDHADLAELRRLMQETSLKTIRVWVQKSLVDVFRGIALPEQWILCSDERKDTVSTALTFGRPNSQLV